ncbi:hypothetical protein [Actinospica robiniae]|uniref:hypothetical protein n=1 Tax=Actinospica robiniae TaxID=304901 RepID=UPI00041F0023|nr:hypothetical protein [Actinospica robiniae]
MPISMNEIHPAALLIGGRCGVGKNTVGLEVSAQLQAASVAHALVNGNFLDHIHPAPEGDPARTKITEANLAAIWRNYAAVGCSRLIYTNMVSILEPDLIARAMGASPRVTMILLTADDETARLRLRGRELGSHLDPHIERGEKMSRYLDDTAPDSAVRIGTDGRTVPDIAREVIAATGWLATG